MTWTPEIVRARFHEAADTERYLPLPRIGSGNGFWPVYHYTAEDREGWDDAARTDNADRWSRDRKLTREAISRHDECLDWSIKLLANETYRHIVWKWAFCQAYGRNFGTLCQRKGWVRTTTYGRLDRSFVRIAEQLLSADILLRLPDEKFLDQPETAAMRPIEFAPRTQARAVHPPFRTDRHVDTLTTPEQIAAFSKYLVQTNDGRRRRRERTTRRPVAA